MDLKGKDIHYYSGRIDTIGGQEKFLSKLSADTIALIPDCSLGVRAYELFPDQVAIFPTSLFWDTWEKAGVKKGEPLARFAAEFLLKEKLPSIELTEKQKAQILIDQQRVLEQIQRIGDSSQQIMEKIAKGSKDPDLCTQAMQNEYESGIFPSQEESLAEHGEPVKIDEDSSFFSRFYKVLEDSY
jgi:hypothetical protein